MRAPFFSLYTFSKKSLALQSFFISLVCFLFTYWHYGFYYTEYEGIIDNFLSGKLTEGAPFRSLYFLCHIGTSYIYSFLYEAFPNIEWISWILYSYSFLSCWLTLYIVRLCVPDSWNWLAGIFIQISIYFIVFADQNIHFNITRVSYLLTGTSFFAITFFFNKKGSISKNRWWFIVLTLMCLLGTLTRTESTTMIFAQLFFFGLFFVDSFKHLFRIYIIPFAFLAVALSAIVYDIYTADEFYKQIEPEIEAQFCERENMIPLSEMHTVQDSIKWNMAAYVVWPDPKVITPEFLRSLVKKDVPYFFDKTQWDRAYRDLTSITVNFYPLAAIAIVFVLLTLLTIKFSRRQLATYLLMVFIFWLIMLVQAYTFKVNGRSFSPPVSFYVLCIFTTLLYFNKTAKRTLTTTLAFAVAGGFLFLHLKYLEEEAGVFKKNYNSYRETLAVVSETAKGKYLVINSSSCDFIFFANKPFHPFDYSAFKKLYVADGYNIPFLPYYRNYLEKECNCNMEEFPSFWNYLQTKGNDLIVLSEQDRIDVLKKYLQVIYDYNLPLQADSTVQLTSLQRSDSRENYFDLTLFRLNP